MTYKQKIEEAKENGIEIQDDLLDCKNIVGVYKFFKIKNEEKECFYIGKSTSIVDRLFGYDGHIYMYLKGDFSKLVPLKIKEYKDEGYTIKVEIIRVNYYDTCFSRATHRLALLEIQEIVKYQEKGQCLLQLPEGVGEKEKNFWIKYYKKIDTNE